MSFLTKPEAISAWTFSRLWPAQGQEITLGELREAYESDTELACFTETEEEEIRRGLLEACRQLWNCPGSDPTQSPSDAAVVPGIAFRPEETMCGKKVLYVASKTTINLHSAFNEKGGLSTAGVGNCGNACALSCTYCSSGNVMRRNPQSTILRVLGKDHGEVIIRRLGALETARRQLTHADGSARYLTPGDERIIEIASLVDPLPTKPLAEETFQLVKLILSLTNWRIRILTKSGLLQSFARRFDETERQRLLLGFSIGIPDDHVARVVERGATLPSTRFRIHRELLGEGFHMFGMSCPVLAVPDPKATAERIAEEIQPDRLEMVWAEVINRRGDSLIRTIAALRNGGFTALAQRLGRVSSSETLWELEYNRTAFLAFRDVIPRGKLAFLTYVNRRSEMWWAQHAKDGAVLL